jgi:hypothetical protein
MNRIFSTSAVAACLLLAALAAEGAFIRGDVDGSGAIEITDAISALGALFLGDAAPACPDGADANDDGAFDIADPVYGLSFLFLGGKAPPPPFPKAGDDPTPDPLGCAECPRGLPCALEEDRLLDGAPAFRNGAPSIAIDADGRPHVLFAAGIEGVAAVRELDGVWRVGPMRDGGSGEAVSMHFGSIAVPAGAREPAALVDLGCLEPGCAQVWNRLPDGSWRRTHAFDGFGVAGQHALLAGRDGGLRAGLFRFASGVLPPRLALGRFADGNWQIDEIGERAWFEEPTLALAPWGEPFLAFWRSPAAEWELAVAGATLEPVRAAGLGSSLLDEKAAALGVAGDAGAPRFNILMPVASDVADVPGDGLDVVAGAPGEDWEAEALARGDSRFRDPRFCFEAPPMHGAECPVDYTRYHALAVLADAKGEVRYLYSRVRESGRLVAECFDPDDFRSCSIVSEIALEGDLRLAWLGEGALESAVIATGVAARRGAAALDASGRLHVVVFDLVEADSKVRYLRFAAR